MYYTHTQIDGVRIELLYVRLAQARPNSCIGVLLPAHLTNILASNLI